MTGKYTINAVDRAGTPWEVCMTDHKDSARDIIWGLVDKFGKSHGRVYWPTLTDDPERGDVEDELYED